MTGYGFIRTIRVIILLLVVVLVPFVACITFVVKEVSLERSYQHRYGDGWQDEYEKVFGELSRAHGKITAASIGIVAEPCLLFWIYKLVTAKAYNTGAKKRPLERRMSNTERVMRARRNALLCNYFGLGGVAVAVLLVLFRWGIFADRDYEIGLGLIVFFAGYCGVISGCWWWLRAKEWSEGVLIIGVAPLGIAFVPFVRLLLLAQPLLLPVTMFMATLILFVVVLVLPDKSGVNQRRAKWDYRDIKRPRDGD